MLHTVPKLRHRGLTGRWPIAELQEPGVPGGERHSRRHARLKSSVHRARPVPNTRRGKSGGRRDSTRGRKGIIDRR